MAQIKIGQSLWLQCEKCLSNILHKDIEHHSSDCPPNNNNITYSFIRDEVLYGILDVKSNEDIKGIVDKEKLVFLSQSAIQLCSLAIGDWVNVVFLDDNLPPMCKVVWPSTEKTLTSVLLMTSSLQLYSWKIASKVKVSKVIGQFCDASQMILITLNAPKSFQISPELVSRIQKTHLGNIYCIGNKVSVTFYGKSLKFEIKSIESSYHNLEDKFNKLNIDNNEFFRIGDTTKWKVFRDYQEFNRIRQEEINLISTIGGLDAEIGEIRHTIKACFTSATTSNFNKSKSILLYGHSGTGKTLLANALTQEFKMNTVKICSADLYSEYHSSPDETLKMLFNKALETCPSIIIVDDIDILIPQRSVRMTDSEKRIVSTVLTQLDKIYYSMKEVFLIAITNKPDSIDPMFRRCGRLDREIEISIPTKKGREDILMKLLDNRINKDDLNEIATITHGFVGADLVSLCQRAESNMLKNKHDQMDLIDFRAALKIVKPSAMREVQVELSDVKWSDIGGQDKLKLILRQAVEWPLRHPGSFRRLGITPPRGILMFGPPGCSKTMIAKALATESQLNFLSIKGPELFSKWVGESERAVREVFRKARQVAPSIVFFDEIDALGGERSSGSGTASVQERVLAQLLTELDGVSPLGDVTILAATNRPDRIDKALLRPGRLDRIVYVPLPDKDTRMEIFKIKLNKMPVTENVCLQELVQLTEGYSGAEVNAVCHEAAMMALEDNLEAEFVELCHFVKALNLITPRTPASLIQMYENYMERKMQH